MTGGHGRDVARLGAGESIVWTPGISHDVQLVPVGKGFYVAHSLNSMVPADLTHVLPEGMSKPVLRVGTEAEWEGWMKQS